MKLALLLAMLAAGTHLKTEEASDGWISLITETTLYGWNAVPADAWTVSPDGTIRAHDGGASTLTTTTSFGDFDLEMRFKPDEGSGVVLGLHCNSGGACRQNVPLGGKPDTWNTVQVHVEGEKATAKVNGILVPAETNAGETVGSIRLSANAHCEFNQIKLLPINMKPLTGWKAYPGRAGSFVMRRDGGIHVENGPSQLETSEEFANFLLQFEVSIKTMRTSPVGSGAVFVRNPPGKLWSGYKIVLDNRYADVKTKKPTATGTGGIGGKQDARRIVGQDQTPMTITVVANGRHLSTWVDGEQQADWTDESAEPFTTGVIALQAVQDLVNMDFRKLRIQTLP